RDRAQRKPHRNPLRRACAQAHGGAGLAQELSAVARGGDAAPGGDAGAAAGRYLPFARAARGERRTVKKTPARAGAFLEPTGLQAAPPHLPSPHLPSPHLPSSPLASSFSPPHLPSPHLPSSPFFSPHLPSASFLSASLPSPGVSAM